MAHEVISPPPTIYPRLCFCDCVSVCIHVCVCNSASAYFSATSLQHGLPPRTATTARQPRGRCAPSSQASYKPQTSGPALRSDNHSFYVQSLETSWAPPAPTHQTPGNWSIFCSLAVHGLTRPFLKGVLPRLRKLRDKCWLRRRKGRGSSSNFGVKTRQSYSRDSMALPAGKAAAQQGQNIHSFCIHASTREKRAESLRCMAGNVNRRIPPTYLG